MHRTLLIALAVSCLTASADDLSVEPSAWATRARGAIEAKRVADAGADVIAVRVTAPDPPPAEGLGYVEWRAALPTETALVEYGTVHFAAKIEGADEHAVGSFRVGMKVAGDGGDGQLVMLGAGHPRGDWVDLEAPAHEFERKGGATRWNQARTSEITLWVPIVEPGEYVISVRNVRLVARPADAIKRVRERLPAVLVLGATVSEETDNPELDIWHSRHALVDPRYRKRLEGMGVVLGYAAWCPALTMDYLEQFNGVVVVNMPYPERHARLAAMLAEKQSLLRQYVDAGGGLLVLRTPGWQFGKDIEATNRLIAPFGGEILSEIVRDPSTETRVLRGALCWTDNIVTDPLTGGVDGLYYPPQCSFYNDYTSPVRVTDEWRVLARGTSTARSWFNPKGGDRDRHKVLPGSFPSEPPLLAVRESGKRRVALWPIASTLVWQDSYHVAWGSGLAMEGQRQGRSGSAARLLDNLLTWLIEPTRGQFGGYLPPPVRETVQVGFEKIDWDRLEMGDPTLPKCWRGLIGARSELSCGKGAPVDFITAAKAAGYHFLAFTERLEMMDAAKFARLKEICAAHTDESFVAIPGLQYTDESGNAWVVFSRSLPWPPKTWLSKRQPGRLAANNALFRGAGNPPMVLLHSHRNPEAPWFQGNFRGFSVYTYENGRLLDDSLDQYLLLQKMRFRLFPVAVRLCDNPAQVTAAATNGFQTYIRAPTPAADEALSGSRGLRVGDRTYWHWSSFVSEGPIVEDFRVRNFGSSDLAIPGGDRIRIHFQTSAPGGLAEVKLMDGQDLFRRWLPGGAASFTQTLDHFHGQQHAFVLVMRDREGRRAVSWQWRTLVQESRFQRCGDNYNTMSGGKYSGAGKGLGNLRGIEDYTFHRNFGWFRYPQAAALAHDTIRPGTQFYPVLASRFCLIVDNITRHRYPHSANPVFDRTDKPELATPTEVLDSTVRYTFFTGWQDGPLVTLVEGKLRFKKDVQIGGNFGLARLRAAEEPTVVASRPGRDDFCGRLMPGVKYFAGRLPRHGYVAVVPNHYHGSTGVIALSEGLGYRAGPRRLDVWLLEPRTFEAGQEASYRMLGIVGPLADRPTNDFVLDVRDSFGLNGDPAWTIEPSIGRVVGHEYVVRIEADSHAVVARVSACKLPVPLPVMVAGLNPNWDAGIWYKGKNRLVEAHWKRDETLHRYTKRVAVRGRDQMRRIGVLPDGTGTLQIDTAIGDKSVFIGSFLVCDQPELRLTLVDWRRGRVRFDAHNATDQPITCTVEPAQGFDLVGRFSRKVTVAPGQSLAVRVP